MFDIYLIMNGKGTKVKSKYNELAFIVQFISNQHQDVLWKYEKKKKEKKIPFLIKKNTCLVIGNRTQQIKRFILY